MNGISYGGWFNPHCRGLVVSGLIGGKTYHVVLVVFSAQESFEPQLSNEVVCTLPQIFNTVVALIYPLVLLIDYVFLKAPTDSCCLMPFVPIRERKMRGTASSGGSRGGARGARPLPYF